MSNSAERVRAHRRRRHRGVRCVTIRLCDPDIDTLVAMDYLAAAECQDAHAISKAAGAFVSDKLYECGKGLEPSR